MGYGLTQEKKCGIWLTCLREWKEKSKKMKSRNLGWGIFMATYWRRGQVFLIGGSALKWESVRPISSYYYRGFKNFWGAPKHNVPLPLLPRITSVIGEVPGWLKLQVTWPPPRSHDHKISMQPGSGPVSVQPYWYPYWQKTEIKHLVKEMLTSGIIKPSNSPNLSPVILIGKHDGSLCMCVDYRSLNKLTIKDKFLIQIIDKLLDELHWTRHSSKLWSMKWVPSRSCFCLDDVPKTAFKI